MRSLLLLLLALFTVTAAPTSSCSALVPSITPVNSCISFTVSAGTGCAWMCTYCANQLGTSSYYFTDNVCTYQPGGCVGNPMTGKVYTCCSA